jgi:hypothetical protein
MPKDALRAEEGPHGDLAVVDPVVADLTHVGRVSVMLEREPTHREHGEHRANEHEPELCQRTHRCRQDAERDEDWPHRRLRQVHGVQIGSDPSARSLGELCRSAARGVKPRFSRQNVSRP